MKLLDTILRKVGIGKAEGESQAAAPRDMNTLPSSYDTAGQYFCRRRGPNASGLSELLELRDGCGNVPKELLD